MPQIEAAGVHQKALEDVGVPAQIHPAQAPGFRRDGRVGALQAFAALAQQARPPGAPNATAVCPAGGAARGPAPTQAAGRRPKRGGGARASEAAGVEAAERRAAGIRGEGGVEEEEGRGRALTRGRRGSHLVVEPGEVGSEGRRDGFRLSRCCGEVLGRITALPSTSAAARRGGGPLPLWARDRNHGPRRSAAPHGSRGRRAGPRGPAAAGELVDAGRRSEALRRVLPTARRDPARPMRRSEHSARERTVPATHGVESRWSVAGDGGRSDRTSPTRRSPFSPQPVSPPH